MVLCTASGISNLGAITGHHECPTLRTFDTGVQDGRGPLTFPSSRQSPRCFLDAIPQPPQVLGILGDLKKKKKNRSKG